ncbi:DUF4231 domain-containing protein [Flavobacterium gelatinilyticum]|uniref:DUF4231 domain-containing protein n=1 Tax=Flavobacterium gelatinilyticum TaxID=3003260 RepID=UPI0024800888|nr:DUF4231 domain-containing protein [Flavobacterium gelatinilyticum]
MKIEQLNKDILYSDIENRIDSIKAKKNINITLFRTTRVVVFIAGAVITILTGWKNDLPFDSENCILIISASISVLAAMEGLFSFKEKGKSNNLLLFELRRLRDRICFDFIKGIYEETKEAHFLKYQEILEAQKALIENSDNDGE